MSVEDETRAPGLSTLDGGTSDGASSPSRNIEVPPGLPERYDDLGLMARGGQGEVRLVWDHKLERELAVKILTRAAPDAWRRFRFETTLTTGLSHPGIIPVHDRGTTDDGRPWFAMKPVDGIELTEAIVAAHGDPPDPRWPRRRLLDVFVRICETMAYAHDQGVVHRDLKPGNVMIGRFGEVWVMDWGLARRIDAPDPGLDAEDDPTLTEDPTLTDPPERFPDTRYDTVQTNLGAVLGTPGYMPPEQADGLSREADRRSDVYALGAILFVILVGRRPPSEAPPPGFVGAASAKPLEELCRSAMALHPEDRPPDADALRRAVVDWFDGARRRAEALELVAEARSMLPRIAEHRSEASRLSTEASTLLDPVPPHAPEAAKHPGWRLQDAAAEHRRAALMRGLDFEQTLQAALVRCPELPEAERLLADHYRAGLERAEAERDADGAARMATLLSAHDDGRHATFLTGRGRLTVLTDRPDVRVVMHRYVERDRRLVAEPTGQVYEGPIEARGIDPGSYLAIIEAEGCVATRYPIYIERGGDWHGIAPGESAPRPVILPPVGSLGPDDVYVPGGWSVVGGDRRAVDPLPRRWVWIDGFVIRRFPVTHRRYGAALDAREPDPSEVPSRLTPSGALSPVYTHTASGWRPTTTDDGQAIAPDWPVTSIDWRSAVAHARFVGSRDGVPWRLPMGLEWEKAARGVDGRWWPWGDAYDASRACTLESFPAAPGPRPVGHAAIDESPYGVRDLVGGVREWCANIYRRHGPEGAAVAIETPPESSEALREGRGGAWSSRAAMGRPAGRFAGHPDYRSWLVGFRLARPIGRR